MKTGPLFTEGILFDFRKRLELFPNSETKCISCILRFIMPILSFYLCKTESIRNPSPCSVVNMREWERDVKLLFCVFDTQFNLAHHSKPLLMTFQPQNWTTRFIENFRTMFYVNLKAKT